MARPCRFASCGNECEPGYTACPRCVEMVRDALSSAAAIRRWRRRKGERTMRLVCAWCGAEMGQADGPESMVSHACCEKCYERMFRDDEDVAHDPKRD